MYAKIFQSIYDGSIARDWQLRMVFQDLLILANGDGVVDMTPDAIASRTRVPLGIVQDAIAKLEEPDLESRRPDLDGRRIERLDAHRTWGWRIVNYKHYRNLVSLEQKREIDRQRLARKREEEKREKANQIKYRRGVSHSVANVAQEEAEEEAYLRESKDSLVRCPYGQLTSLWNSLVKEPKILKVTSQRKSKILSRWKEHPDLEWWQSLFSKVASTPFLRGESPRGWKADLDWLVKNDENALRVLEGRYDGGERI